MQSKIWFGHHSLDLMKLKLIVQGNLPWKLDLAFQTIYFKWLFRPQLIATELLFRHFTVAVPAIKTSSLLMDVNLHSQIYKCH